MLLLTLLLKALLNWGELCRFCDRRSRNEGFDGPGCVWFSSTSSPSSSPSSSSEPSSMVTTSGFLRGSVFSVSLAFPLPLPLPLPLPFMCLSCLRRLLLGSSCRADRLLVPLPVAEAADGALEAATTTYASLSLELDSDLRRRRAAAADAAVPPGPSVGVGRVGLLTF